MGMGAHVSVCFFLFSALFWNVYSGMNSIKEKETYLNEVIFLSKIFFSALQLSIPRGAFLSVDVFSVLRCFCLSRLRASPL